MTCSIKAGAGGLYVQTPYRAGFVAALKASIPATDRKFDGDMKVWLISPAYGATAAKLIEQYYRERVTVPQTSGGARPVLRMLDVRYLGQCKIREDGTRSAFGWSDGEWRVIFPEEVLRVWFDPGAPRLAEQSTFYTVLGARRDMTADELKGAYRRAARQWHPDVCKDPDAHEIFVRIQRAWAVLNDEEQRARYDAGLAMEDSLKPTVRLEDVEAGYRAPLKSGLILATGRETIGRFVVAKIEAWEDIVDGHGRTLVTSWPIGARCPVETWT